MKTTRLLIVILMVGLVACDKNDTNPAATRSYRMGFANSTPRYDITTVLNTLNMWTSRSDAAIISSEIPWDSLYAGVAPADYISRQYVSLVNFYNSKNLPLYIYMDPANGLNRAINSNKLIALGKSITQPDVQTMYTRFLWTMDSMLKPVHIGFAMETNLIRALSPDSIYQAVKAVANNTAAFIRARDSKVQMGVSVQADWAWGRFNGGTYIGIAQDFTDFPFVQEIGISSYPYFAFNNPEDMPANYFSQLVAGKNLPVFVAEGGWSSATVRNGGGFTSSPQKQVNYFRKVHQLLDNANAMALFQLTFNDINTNLVQPADTAALQPFTFIGLVDTNLQPKPVLPVWDSLCQLRLR